MCGRRTERAYVADMIQACELILVFARGRADEELMDPRDTPKGAILQQLIVLGEAAKYVSDTSRERWPHIPWTKMTGMRDRIVHYYQGIDDELVLGAIKISIPAVLPQLREMLAAIDQEYPPL